jgi:hypothetical protein
VVRSQPGQTVLWNPISKKPIIKKGWWSGSRHRPWVQTPQKKIACPTCTTLYKHYKIVLAFTIINGKHWNSPIEQGLQVFFFYVLLKSKRKITCLTRKSQVSTCQCGKKAFAQNQCFHLMFIKTYNRPFRLF